MAARPAARPTACGRRTGTPRSGPRPGLSPGARGRRASPTATPPWPRHAVRSTRRCTAGGYGSEASPQTRRSRVRIPPTRPIHPSRLTSRASVVSPRQAVVRQHRRRDRAVRRARGRGGREQRIRQLERRDQGLRCRERNAECREAWARVSGRVEALPFNQHGPAGKQGPAGSNGTTHGYQAVANGPVDITADVLQQQINLQTIGQLSLPAGRICHYCQGRLQPHGPRRDEHRGRLQLPAARLERGPCVISRRSAAGSARRTGSRRAHSTGPSRWPATLQQRARERDRRVRRYPVQLRQRRGDYKIDNLVIQAVQLNKLN